MDEPVTKHFFDSQNNPDGVEDDGTWPFHPTSAGRRWIDLGSVLSRTDLAWVGPAIGPPIKSSRLDVGVPGEIYIENLNK